MAVAIRLRRVSDTAKKRYNFRISVMEKARSRDDKVIEELGYYDPSKKPASVKIDKARVEHWVKLGAQMSDTVKSLMKK